MSRATYLGADLGRAWIAEFSIAGWRAVVAPAMNGRPPFLITVHDPQNFERARFDRIQTAGAAVEKALTFVAAFGVVVDNRAEVFQIAGQLDAAAELPVTLGIPREIAAFASGISACGTRNFHVIAASIAALGMGTYDQAALRLAVQDWSRETMRSHDEAQADVSAAVDRTRSGPSS